jgi:sensor histidine kinase YesM
MNGKALLRHRYIISIVIYTAVLLLLWTGYHTITHQAISVRERDNTILAADNLTQQISAEFRQMNTVASVIAGSEYIHDFLGEKDYNAFYNKALTVSEIVRRTAFPISDADSVIAISDSGRYFRFSGGLSDTALDSLLGIFFDSDSVYTVIELDGALYFCHSVPVIDYSGRRPVRLGNVIMLNGLDRTRRALDYGDGVDRAVFLDSIVILSNKPEIEGMAAGEVEPLYGVVSVVAVEGTPLTVSAAIPGDALFPESALFYGIAFASLILLLIMVYMLFRYQSGQMIRPMANIIAGVRAIGNGNECCEPGSGRLPETGISDFDALVSDINAMLDRTEEYNAALAAERQKLFDNEIARQNMRISLLSSQMDAHFIVNTLKSVKSLSDMGETDKAGQMAEGLAAILQHLHAGDALVDVFDDLQILERYVDIMNIKFDNKFNVEYHVDDKLESCKMPILILQPIVENALMHGLGSKEENARLVIKGRRQGDSIIFEVSDNGTGIPPDKLKGIQDSLAQTELSDFPKPGLRGVALGNIQRRLRIKHGDGYGVTVTSVYGEGTTVTITLPVILNS